MSLFIYRFPSLVSLLLASALEKRLTEEILKHSLVLRRHKNSDNSSQVGFTRYTIHIRLLFTCVSTYRRTVLAMSEWARFSFGTSVEPTPTATVGGETADDQVHINIIPPSPNSSTPSDQPNGSPNSFTPTSDQPDGSPNQPNTILSQLDTVPSGVALNHPDIVLNQQDTTPTQPSHASNPPGIPGDQPGTGVTAPHPDISYKPVTATTVPILSQPHSQASASPPLNTLIGITNEPTWMKKKRTLNYFRNTFKLGDLPNVIGHWYELEELLGFQDTVSTPKRLALHRAHIS